MEKFVRLLGFLVLFFGLNSTVMAGNFKSIYSIASSSIPTSSGIVLLGGSFKNMYAPTGVSGCNIGIPELSSFCVNSGSSAYGGLSFTFNEYSYPTGLDEIKIYLPPGTLRFSLVASLPQSTIAAAALRMDVAPTRIAPLSSTEYSSYQATSVTDSVLKQLLAGNEVIRTHDGGGTYAIAGGYVNGMNFKEATTVGHWLYIRFINPVDLYQVMGTVMINNAAYQAGYLSIQWDANGDPVDTATPTTSFSITPNPSTALTQGVSSTIAITPSSGFTLNSCSAASVSASSYNNNSMTLTPNSANPVTITCISTTDVTATATLQVQAAPTTAFSSFTLSPSSLLKTDTATPITIVPNAGAVVPATTVCQVMQMNDYLIPFGNNQWKINPSANLTQIAQSLTIKCGSDASGNAIASNFSILEPLTIVRNSADLKQLTDLTFTFTPTLPTGISTADVYIFVYVPSIPISAFKKTTTLYGYQVKNGKVQINGSWTDVQNQLLPILFSPPEAYQKYVSSGTSFTVNLGYGVRGDVATDVSAEYYVAYLPTGTTDLTKLQFIGDKQGSFSGIPVFWKF